MHAAEFELLMRSPDLNSMPITDLEDLAAEIRASTGVTRIAVEGEARLGPGTSFAEVLEFVLPTADFVRDSLYTLAIGTAVKWMRRRYTRKYERGRPRIIVVLDHDGNVLAKHEVNAQPELETAQEEADRARRHTDEAPRVHGSP